MKKIFVLFFAFFLLAGAVWAAKVEYKEFANESSDRYHAFPPVCKVAKKNLDYSDPKDLIYFKDSAEAEAKGLVPCKLCHRVPTEGNFNKKS